MGGIEKSTLFPTGRKFQIMLKKGNKIDDKIL